MLPFQQNRIWGKLFSTLCAALVRLHWGCCSWPHLLQKDPVRGYRMIRGLEHTSLEKKWRDLDFFLWQTALNSFERKFQRWWSQALFSSNKLRCSMRGVLETQIQKKSCHQKCSEVLNRFPTEVMALPSLEVFSTWQVKYKHDPSSTGHSPTFHFEIHSHRDYRCPKQHFMVLWFTYK